MARRDYGSGSVVDRGNGRWQAKAYVTVGGERTRIAATGSSRADALRRLERRKEQLRASSPERSPGEPLAAYLEAWLRDNEPRLKATTHRRYELLARNQIVPTLGRTPLGRLAPADLRALYRELGTRLAPRTVGHVHRLLHKVLGDALDAELLDRNPAERVRPPRVPRAEGRRLTEAECGRLLRAARGERYEALWWLALTTTMRLGELLSLRWADVDLGRATVEVRRSVAYLSRRGFVADDAKSASGHRRLRLHPATLGKLREHRERQRAEMARASGRWRDMGLVFPSSVGTYAQQNNVLRWAWRPLLERAGLPYLNMHAALRHSAVTSMVTAGEAVTVVQRAAGHAQGSTTLNVYAHGDDDATGEALWRLTERLLRAEMGADGSGDTRVAPDDRERPAPRPLGS